MITDEELQLKIRQWPEDGCKVTLSIMEECLAGRRLRDAAFQKKVPSELELGTRKLSLGTLRVFHALRDFDDIRHRD